MKIAIIAENKIDQETLRQSFSSLYSDVRTYDYGDKRQEESDIIICVVSVKVKANALSFAKKTPSFAVLDEDTQSSSDMTEDFVALFKKPVRLGALLDSVQNYHQQRQLRDSLKPIKMGAYQLDPKTNMFELPAPAPAIKLTEKEQDILLYLHTNRAEAVTRQDLLNHVWGYVEGVETHTLETHIYRLRQKIENDPAAPNFLMTNDDGYYLNF